MPRKHPDLGVMVQTLGEFWQNEAEREGLGRSGGDVASDFWAEVDEDSRRQERELLADRVGLLERLKAWDADCDDSDRIRFLDVVEICAVEVRQGTRQSGCSILARVATEARGEIFISYEMWSDAGSYHEPPDGGTDCLILTPEKFAEAVSASARLR